jgi:hypothetical protein
MKGAAVALRPSQVPGMAGSPAHAHHPRLNRRQAEADASLAALRREVDAGAVRLRGYERLLGQALSIKGVAICFREAQALKVRSGALPVARDRLARRPRHSWAVA